MISTKVEECSPEITRLAGEVEEMHRRMAQQKEHLERLLASVERMVDLASQSGEAKAAGEKLQKRIEDLMEELGKGGCRRGINAEKEFSMDKKIVNMMNYVKIAGRILTALAISVEQATESVSSVIRPGEVLQDRKEEKYLVRTQADLINLLQPITMLVKNLVEENFKNQGLGNTAQECDEINSVRNAESPKSE